LADAKEIAACTPHPVDPKGLNQNASLPFGLTTGHMLSAMQEFIDLLGFLNAQMVAKQVPRLESFFMTANFSSFVGELMVVNIAKFCPTITKNKYHNGYPDLIPVGHYPGDSAQHGDVGIEVKASHYIRGWQGHNAEDGQLMVFMFDSNRPNDKTAPMPFRFLAVATAFLSKSDWSFSGRKGASRRTITASVTDAGRQKMLANWVYRDPEFPNLW